MLLIVSVASAIVTGMNEQTMIINLVGKGLTLADIQRQTGIASSSLSFVRDGKRQGFTYTNGKRLEELHDRIMSGNTPDPEPPRTD